MATAEEGGATATTITNSTYGGGGAGGKLRKKPFRKQTTPYDRPSTSVRANNNENNNSWLTKLVVDPASKLISYGANRFFASVFRRRLTSPQPPQPLPPPVQAELNYEVDEGHQGATPNLKNQYGAKEPSGFEISQPINGSSSNRISELEQLLKQKTFTRSEIDHLTDLLRSRAMEVSLGDDRRKNERTASDFGTQPQFGSGPVDVNRNEGIRSQVLEDEIASPAELAKAYMGSRPLKVSPSTLGMHSQVGREDTGLLNSTPFAPKSPTMTMTTKTSVGAPENGFITPRSRGRSAIYNMARTPYSRFHPTSAVKGTGVNNSVYSRPSMSPSSLSVVERGDKFESKQLTLKRRSSVLDDDVGSVGPIRRIRPKPNLIAPRITHSAHGVRIGSAKQKFPLIGDTNHKLSRTVVDTENSSTPSTSYAVPSKSSEVAARILQHLENLTPKEKSSESKLVAAQEKSPFRLTPGMLRGQALRSMESSKVLMDVQDDHKLEYRSNPALPDARDSTSRKDGRVEENSTIPSDIWNHVKNNNSAVSLKASEPGTGTSDSVVITGASQPPHKKRTFRMSALEDSFEQDDLHCNGIEPRPFSDGSRPTEELFMGSNLSPAEDPKLGKTTVLPEVKAPSGIVFRQTSELGYPGSVMVGEGSSNSAFPASEEPSAAPQSAVLPPSGAIFDKPKDTPPLFSFSSKVAEKFQPLASESSSKTPESKLEISSSLVNISAPTGSQSVIPELNKSVHLNPLKAADGIGKSDGPSAASNGPLFPKPPSMSFAAASSNDTDQVSTGGAFLFTSSMSVPNSASTGTVSSTSATSIGSIFGSAVVPSTFAAPIAKLSAPIDSQPKAEVYRSSGSSSSSHLTVATFAAASSGSSIFGLTSSASFSTGNSLQSSLFGSASKSFGSGDGAGSQDAAVKSVSSASLPSFGINSSSSFGSCFSNSQVFNPSNTFGFSSAASSSDARAVVATSEPTSSIPHFGASSTAVSESTAVSSSSNSSPGIFGFGLNSSSPSTNAAVGSSNGSNPNPSLFSFAANSSPVPPAANTTSSFSSSTSGIFNFSGITSASSSAMNSNCSSSTAPSTVFGSSWQNPTSSSSIFGSTFTSSSGPSPSTGFIFGTSSTSSAPTNAASIFSSSTGAPSSPVFSFTSPSASALSTPPPSLGQQAPVFGFATSPGNNDQMNAEDSMAEDPVQSSAASVFGQPPMSRSSSAAVFGQPPAVSPSPPGFMFGQTVQPQANPFQFGGQQNQAAPLTPTPNPNPFQASSSLDFNSGGSFSLGSGGDKSGRRIVRINKNRNRKK